MTTHRDNDGDASSDKIAFVNFKDDEELRGQAPRRDGAGLFRRAYDANASVRPREHERRIKFEVVDDSAAGARKRGGFNPYDTTSPPKKGGPRR